MYTILFQRLGERDSLSIGVRVKVVLLVTLVRSKVIVLYGL